MNSKTTTPSSSEGLNHYVLSLYDSEVVLIQQYNKMSSTKSLQVVADEIAKAIREEDCYTISVDDEGMIGINFRQVLVSSFILGLLRGA